MHETEKMKAYVSYKLDDEHGDLLRSLLLKEKREIAPKIEMNGQVYNARRQLPKTVLDDLATYKGAIITPLERITYVGQKDVFGIPFTRAQTVTIDGEKYIQIRVLADNIFMLTDSIDKIKNQMAIYGLEPKLCAWNQFGKLDVAEFKANNQNLNLEEATERQVKKVTNDLKEKMRVWSSAEQAKEKPVIQEIEPTVKPEFDAEKLKAQKVLELETYRRENITHT